MSIVAIHDLTYTYGGADTEALRDVSLTVEAGEWVVLQGVTGSGKSTLLKTLTGACPEFYGGTIAGQVLVNGIPVEQMTPSQRVSTIGFVGQDPEVQSVYSVLDREVAFALENIGTKEEDMKWLVAEALELVGLSDVARQRAAELSGGQKQRLALAAALVHQPRLLLLDEPTSQLDPVSANDLLDHLHRLQQDFGMTIILSEHRLDAVYGLADRVVYMDGGQVQFAGTAREAARFVRAEVPSQAPSLVRLFPDCESPALTVREARNHLLPTGPGSAVSEPVVSKPVVLKPVVLKPVVSEPAVSEPVVSEPVVSESALSATPQHGTRATEDLQAPRSGAVSEDKLTDTYHEQRSPLITLHKVSVTYRGARRHALDECSLQIEGGCVTAVIGPNGSGKSTFLRVIAGLIKPTHGRVTAGDKGSRPRIAYLPQKPSDLFSQLTVRDELRMGLQLQGQRDEAIDARVQDVVRRLQLLELLDRGPRDLSGGEQMRVALGSLLVDSPNVLLLDEPTRGLDSAQKDQVVALLRHLSSTQGMSIVMVSHDMELVADVALQVVFLSGGRVVLMGKPEQVFSKALYFSPAISRVFRGIDDGVQSLQDARKRGWAE